MWCVLAQITINKGEGQICFVCAGWPKSYCGFVAKLMRFIKTEPDMITSLILIQS
jgi:hypothetical protein